MGVANGKIEISYFTTPSDSFKWYGTGRNSDFEEVLRLENFKNFIDSNNSFVSISFSAQFSSAKWIIPSNETPFSGFDSTTRNYVKFPFSEAISDFTFAVRIPVSSDAIVKLETKTGKDILLAIG